MDAEKTTGELIKDANTTIDAETSTADQPQFPAQDAAIDKSDATDQIDFDKDEEFQKVVPSEFHKNPRFRQIYKNWKDNERKAKELEAKLGQGPDLTDEELLELAKERGLYQDTPETKPEPEPPKEKYDWNNLTPEQRQFIEFLDAHFERKSKPLMEKLSTYDEFVSKAEKEKVQSHLDSTEQEAIKMVKDMGLDWEQEVKPDVMKFIKERRRSNPDFGKGLDVVDVVNMVLGPKSRDIGKRLGQEELRKLNEKKKSSQVESEQMGGDSKEDFSKMSTRDTIKFALGKYKE